MTKKVECGTAIPIQDGQLWTRSQLVKFYGISASRLARARSDGTLPAIELGRSVYYEGRDIIEWMRGLKDVRENVPAARHD